MKRYHIKFEYQDEYTNGKWSKQECSIYAKSEYDARAKCIELYGLTSCTYRFTSVELEAE